MNSSKKLPLSIIFFSILFISVTQINAQNFEKIEKQAIRSFEKKNFVQARDQFLILHKADWNNINTTAYLASCYLQLKNPLKAEEMLSSIKENDPWINYLKIETSFYLEKFEETERLISNFGDTTGYKLQPIIQKLSHARMSYSNEKGYLVQNFGSSVNSKDMEYSAVMFDDFNKLLFTVRKENKELTDGSGLAFETVYATEVDSTHNWKNPVPLDISVQDKKSHDATVQIYDSGKKMISYHNGRLYLSTLNEGVMVKKEYLYLHDVKDATDTHCFITPDEKTLFFASDYRSTGGDLDLYTTTKNEKGEWSEPEPMTHLNTNLDEDSPFLASDNTFYFSSRGHNSMGGFDVFKSVYDSLNKEWGAPENMGTPINSVEEDIYFTTEGKVGYMSSSRLGGQGSLDLYRVFLFNKVKVNGKLVDDNGKPVADATIDIKYDTTTLRTYTDDQGDYEMFVPINQEVHATFIKDSLNLFEGDYIVNIFMKDQNDNKFNFYVDYLDSDNSPSGKKQVEHINVDIKNDYEHNPAILSVNKKEEEVWADSLNVVLEQKELTRRELTQLKIAENKKNIITSKNFEINQALIQIKEKEKEEEKEENIADWAVQILAMSTSVEPDQTFFDKLGPYAVANIDGKDGLRRFFIRQFQTKKEAKSVLKVLKKAGYKDAFLRKSERYLTL